MDRVINASILRTNESTTVDGTEHTDQNDQDNHRLEKHTYLSLDIEVVQAR